MAKSNYLTTIAIDTRHSTIHFYSMNGNDKSSITHKIEKFTGAKLDEHFFEQFKKAIDDLTLKNVEASFTLVRIGDEIHISGRSAGKINVQLILEKLHGGGHFDVAGAQVVSDSVEDVADMLKSAIDEYLDER